MRAAEFTQPQQKKSIQSIADHVAKLGHQSWRKSFQQTNGNDTPRIKKTTDQQWIDRHGTDQVNINSDYHTLPEDWKGENKENGKVVAKLLSNHYNETGSYEMSPEQIENAAEIIHNEWMRRNPKQDWNAAQHVPYNDLPEDEKQKDRDMIIAGIQFALQA